MNLIYIVEDDEGIRELVTYALKKEGFEVVGFESGKEVFEQKPPDLYILDIMLPGEDGYTILKKIRTMVSTKDIPVIMTTAKGTEFDKVKGLDLGADDYLVKPFGMMEMISRIKAVLRRTSNQEQETHLTIKNLSLDAKNYTVRNNGQKIELTLKEFDLLSLLMLNPGRVFTRQKLLDKVWGEHFIGETRTVDVHIGTLRMKLGDASHLIKTVRGVGYRLEVTDD